MPLLKRIFKIIVMGLIILLILGCLGAFALAKWVNPNHFKPQIIAMVNQSTGRALTLPGNLSWNFFPRLGIHVGAAALSNPAAFTQVNFAEIQSADLYLNWNALLQGKIAVSSMNVSGLQLFLRQKGHENNWTFAHQTPQSKTVSAPIYRRQSKAIDFSVDAFSLSHAQVTYDNDQSHCHIAISELNLTLNQFNPNQDFPVLLNANVNVNDNLTGNVKVNMLAQINFKKETLSFDHLALQSNLTYFAQSDQKIHLSAQISGGLNLDLNQQTLLLNEVSFDFNQIVNGTLNVNVKGWNTLNYSGLLKLSAFSLPDLSESLGLPFPTFPNKLILQQVTISTHFSGNARKLNLNPLKMGFTGTQIQGNVNVTSFQPLRLGESLNADQIDTSDFVNLSGAKLPMQNIALSGTVRGGRNLQINQNVNIQNLTLLGFDLRALIDSLNQLATNLLNIRNLVSASSEINQSMLALQQNQGPINAGNGKHTDLGSLKANIVLSQGVLTTPVMDMKGPLVQVKGSGQIDLGQKNMDYLLTSQLVAPGKVKGLVIPYKISGSFDQLKQGVEWPIVHAEMIKYVSLALGSTVTHSLGSVVGGAVNALKDLLK
ncbi:MAG: AsmA family protein [Gammaproteobacteria bacterium]|nr:AsmA family protein [Gammaproteobacteria bacterium]